MVGTHEQTNSDEENGLFFPHIDIDECLSGKHSCEGNTTLHRAARASQNNLHILMIFILLSQT